MKQRNMAMSTLVSSALALTMSFSGATAVRADNELLKLKNHTEVKLAFDDDVDSKTAKAGETVHLHVLDPVIIDGKRVIAPDTHVIGTIRAVHHRGKFGQNAKIQMVLAPIKATNGAEIPLGFKTKTGDMARGGEAAGASIGGAMLLGPIGLVGGYFVTGKNVHVHPGDKMTVEVSKDVLVKSME